MLGGCPDGVLEIIVILATQWDSCYTYIQKSTKSKMRCDYFHRKNPLFTMTGNAGIVYSYI